MIRQLLTQLFRRPAPLAAFGDADDEKRIDVQIQPCHTVLHLPNPNGEMEAIVCAYEVSARSPFWPDEASVKGWFTTQADAKTWSAAVATAADLLIWCRLDSPPIQKESYRWKWDLLAIGYQPVPLSSPHITVRDIAFVGTGERSAIVISVRQILLDINDDKRVENYDYLVAIWLPSPADTIQWIRWCIKPAPSLPPLEGIVAAHEFWARIALGEVVRVTRSDGWEGMVVREQPRSPSSCSSYTVYLYPQGHHQGDGIQANVEQVWQGVELLLHTPVAAAMVLTRRADLDGWCRQWELWEVLVKRAQSDIPDRVDQHVQHATIERFVAEGCYREWTICAIVRYQCRSDSSSSQQHEQVVEVVAEGICWLEALFHLRHTLANLLLRS